MKPERLCNFLKNLAFFSNKLPVINPIKLSIVVLCNSYSSNIIYCMSTLHRYSHDHLPLSEHCILTDSKRGAKSAPTGALMLPWEHLVILSLNVDDFVCFCLKNKYKTPLLP